MSTSNHIVILNGRLLQDAEYVVTVIEPQTHLVQVTSHRIDPLSVCIGCGIGFVLLLLFACRH